MARAELTRVPDAGNEILHPNGWRKPTETLIQADRFADIGQNLSIPKARAIVAVKKVAAVLGLKAQDLLLLDTFGAFTQPRDWENGKRPIVWPSNRFLTEQTGFSLSTLRRHIKRLCDLRLISVRDSANGKRWGRRNSDGHIEEAYGFDLSPLAARCEEFEALNEQIQSNRKECASLRRQITICRRMIRATIEHAQQQSLPGNWSELGNVFDAMMANLPKQSVSPEPLADFLAQLRDLYTRIEDLFAQVSLNIPTDEEDQLKPTSPKNGTHTTTTNELHPVTCNRKEDDNEQTDTHQTAKPTRNRPAKPQETKVSIPMLMSACPNFAELANQPHEHLKSWDDVHRAAGALGPMVGITEEGWQRANQVLGPAAAAATLALVVDKASTGEVRSPGGYLRAMITRAETGELHLERSVFGRRGRGDEITDRS